jgi:predicted RNA polymerase sigma factor
VTSGVDRPDGVEGLLRQLAPRALGAVVRRYGHFDDAEDAVQEALVAAATTWPQDGLPDNPLGWLVRTATRRMTDLTRNELARRRREDLAASWSRDAPSAASGHDDTLVLFYTCCHPALSPTSAVALTLRALGGLSTREIAAAFLVPEATMAQRISRAKRTVAESGEPFALPEPDRRAARTALVLQVAYLIFNEGYASSDGPELGRTDLAAEAVRLARLLHELLPDDAEVVGLLALMVLTEARRGARTNASGALVPLAEQERSRWDRGLIMEGTALATTALRQMPAGPYALQAAIAALHDGAPRHEDADWERILSLYRLLEQVAPGPVVQLNGAVALAMVAGPDPALARLDELAGSDELARSHRLHAVRAHVLEMKGDRPAAHDEYTKAAARTGNRREREYLTMKAAATRRPEP